MKLEVLDSPQDRGRVFSFEDKDEEIVIGRGNDCQVTLHDAEASRAHARIVLREGIPFVQDLGSKNGTRLNGEPVAEARLSNDDRLLVGSSLLKVIDLAATAPTSISDLPFSDDTESVLVTIDHRAADIVSGRSPDVPGDEMAHENKILREVCRVSQLLAAKEESQGILQRILEATQQVLSADTVCLLTRKAEDEDWTVRVSVGDVSNGGALNVSRTIIDQALDEGIAILSTDPLSDDRFDASKSIVTQGVSSAVCTPLQVGDMFGGILFMDRRRRREAFGQMDLRFTATVGNLLGIFLEREQYEQEIQRKARLAIIGEIVAGLAHYIKNVITGFNLSISNLEMAIERKKDEWIAPCIRTISSMERRIADLMLNMLTYAKERKPEPSDVDVQKLVDDLTDPYRSQLEEHGIAFESDVDPCVTRICADEQALFRVFLNLFLNSLDSLKAKKEGEKTIRMSVGPSADGNGVEFRFRDTGSGIPADRLPQIFAAFFSTKGSRGTGLGLAVVHKIVQEHGGEISVDSVENEWTEFHIILPQLSEQAAEQVATQEE